jgi:hypothetical protein
MDILQQSPTWYGIPKVSWLDRQNRLFSERRLKWNQDPKALMQEVNYFLRGNPIP